MSFIGRLHCKSWLWVLLPVCTCPFNRRVRDKYEAELKEVEHSEKNTLEKYNSMKVGGQQTCSLICAVTTHSLHLPAPMLLMHPFTVYWHNYSTVKCILFVYTS